MCGSGCACGACVSVLARVGVCWCVSVSMCRCFGACMFFYLRWRMCLLCGCVFGCVCGCVCECACVVHVCVCVRV